MKETYIAAELQIVLLETEDIITTSPKLGGYDTPFEPAE